MEGLYEQISYLRGLADGLDISEDSKEGKFMLAMVDVIDEMAIQMEEMLDFQDETDEYLDLLDEDLSKVEEVLFVDYDLDDDCGCDCGCDCDDLDFIQEESDEDVE